MTMTILLWHTPIGFSTVFSQSGSNDAEAPYARGDPGIPQGFLQRSFKTPLRNNTKGLNTASKECRKLADVKIQGLGLQNDDFPHRNKTPHPPSSVPFPVELD
jgi:hypothetical protein